MRGRTVNAKVHRLKIFEHVSNLPYAIAAKEVGQRILQAADAPKHAHLRSLNSMPDLSRIGKVLVCPRLRVNI